MSHHHGHSETTAAPGIDIHHEPHEHHEHHQKGSPMHSMAMAMHWGYEETVLFSWWVISSPGGMAASMLGTALLAAVFEGVKYYREYLFWRSVTAQEAERRERGLPLLRRGLQVDSEESEAPRRRLRPHGMWDRLHLLQTALQVLHVLLSYAQMLIFMTMNCWLCIAVLVGNCLGFFLFAWKRPTVVETVDSCH